MPSCASCLKEFDWVNHEYSCCNCNKAYCDDCCANTGYFIHLRSLHVVINAAVEKGGYLCQGCLAQIPGMPEGWHECIIDRRCAEHGCDKDLSAIHTSKNACAKCGRLFCGSHSKPLSDLGPHEAKKHHVWNSDCICKECTPRHQEGRGWVDEKVATGVRELEVATSRLVTRVREEAETLTSTLDAKAKGILEHTAGLADQRVVNARQELGQELDRLLEIADKRTKAIIDHADSKINQAVAQAMTSLREEEARITQKVKEMARTGYVLLGLRVSLVALAVFILGSAGPRAVKFAREGGHLWHTLWNATTAISAGGYLCWEFILPGLKEPPSRYYAIGFIVAVLVTGAYLFIH